LNYDYKTAGDKCLIDMHVLYEHRNEAHKRTRLCKEKFKIWNDRSIKKWEFKEEDKVLLYTSRLKLFAGKLNSKWEESFIVKEASL
jgi:hypothetical protein